MVLFSFRYSVTRYRIFSEVSDPALIGGPALIGDGNSHVKDPALIIFSERSDPALIRGGAYWRQGGY